MEFELSPSVLVFSALALALTVSCVLLAARRSRRIEEMSVPSLREMVRELRKLPVEDRALELLRLSPEGTWENKLGREVVDAGPDDARIAAANDVLFDLDHEIDIGKTWSTSAVRIAVAGTGLLGLTAYLARSGPATLAASLLIGFVGAAISFGLGERGKERAAARREAFDSLVKTILPEEPTAARSIRARRRSGRV